MQAQLPPPPPPPPSRDSTSTSSTSEASSSTCSAYEEQTALPVGMKLLAMDCRQMWCPAVVKDERGCGDEREVLIHYQGWKKKWDEWLSDKSARLRQLDQPVARSVPDSDHAGQPPGKSKAGATHTVAVAPHVAAAQAYAAAKAKAAKLAAEEAAAAAKAAKLARAAATAAAKLAASMADGDEEAFRKEHMRGVKRERERAEAAAAGAVGCAAIAQAAATDAVVTMSDGERVLAESMTINDGEYERCGTFGCILANRHAGMHLFQEPAGKRRQRA